MSKYVFKMKMTAAAHEIGPDLAEYLEKEGHKMCPRCSRPMYDIENPFKDMDSEYGDFGISKLLGCHSECSGEPTKWRFGNYSQADIVAKQMRPKKTRDTPLWKNEHFEKMKKPRKLYNNHTITAPSVICSVGPGSTTVGRPLKAGQYVEEEKDSHRVRMTVYNTDGTIDETYVVVGRGAKIKIPGYNS